MATGDGQVAVVTALDPSAVARRAVEVAHAALAEVGHPAGQVYVATRGGRQVVFYPGNDPVAEKAVMLGMMAAGGPDYKVRCRLHNSAWQSHVPCLAVREWLRGYTTCR